MPSKSSVKLPWLNDFILFQVVTSCKRERHFKNAKIQESWNTYIKKINTWGLKTTSLMKRNENHKFQRLVVSTESTHTLSESCKFPHHETKQNKNLFHWPDKPLQSPISLFGLIVNSSKAFSIVTLYFLSSYTLKQKSFIRYNLHTIKFTCFKTLLIFSEFTVLGDHHHHPV